MCIRDRLTRYLMNKYGVPASHVIRHYDVTGKICPNPYVYNTSAHTWDCLLYTSCDATDIARKYQQGETEVTIPLNTYIAMLKTRGGAELENYGKNINFVSTINTNSNLKFKADFDLGDRITCKETKLSLIHI